MSADDLIVSLRKLPSPEEHAVAEGVGLSDGHPVPFHMFAKIAFGTYRNAEWIGEAEATKKWVRRHSRIALSALVMNLAAGVGLLLHNASEGGAAAERAVQVEQRALERRDALEREIQDLRLDVRELRATLRRVSGLSPEPSSDVDMPWTPLPDKVSSLCFPSCINFASQSH